MDSQNAYVYGPSGTPFEQVNLSTGTVRYLLSDALGSVRGVINSTGSLTATTTYDAWGGSEATGGLAPYTPFGYGGYYTDPTGLAYLRARYYDPATGQFLSRDPLEALTGRPYSYAGNDPVNETDPSGLLGCGDLGPFAGACNTVSSGVSTVVGGAGSTIGAGATWVYNHPVETVGVAAGGVSLATGVGEVVAGGAAVTEGMLGGVSVGSGVLAAVVDTRYCLAGSGISCVGAGVGLLATGGGAAVAFGVATDTAASGATAIGLTFGGIGLLGDLAGAAKGATLVDLCSYSQNGLYGPNGL